LRYEKANGEGSRSHLFVVGADEVEHKAPVHEGQQVIQEEGQTAIQPLHKLHILRDGGERATYDDRKEKTHRHIGLFKSKTTVADRALRKR